jgi:hypothetical protein
MGDMINTALQNNALNKKDADALKQYIADYKAMKDKGIVQQMEMQGGKIGRGSQQVFQSIIDQIPSGKTADSATARRQIANLQATQDRLMSQYRDDGKEQAYKMKAGTDTGTLPPAPNIKVPKGSIWARDDNGKGQVVGYQTPDGVYHELPK